VDIVNPPELAPPSAAYSHGVVVGDRIFIAGQVALDPEGKIVGEGYVAAQTRKVVSNIAAILKAAGARLQDVVYTTVYLTSFKHYVEYNQAYIEAFGGHKPARATVGAELFKPEFLVEIQAIAVKGAGHS